MRWNRSGDWLSPQQQPSDGTARTRAAQQSRRDDRLRALLLSAGWPLCLLPACLLLRPLHGYLGVLFCALLVQSAAALLSAHARQRSAMEAERLIQETERQRRLNEHLRQMAARLAGQRDQEELLNEIAASICSLDYAGCLLILLEQDPRARPCFAGFLKINNAPQTVPICCPDGDREIRNLQHGQITRFRNPAGSVSYGDTIRDCLLESGITEMLCVPICYQGQALGALGVLASPTQGGQTLAEDPIDVGDSAGTRSGAVPDPFSPPAERFLSTLADYAALGLSNALLHQQMSDARDKLEEQHLAVAAQNKELVSMNAHLLSVQAELEAQYRALESANARLSALATTDSMTGLANHRAFQEEWTRQIARVERSHAALSLLLLDVDDFKQYNDSFGHPAGDEVLKGVGQILQSSVREGDFPARYGGEEFAIILTDTDAEIAAQVAERIRRRVENHVFPNRNITVSIGVTHRLPNETTDVIIQRVDVALYEAKTAGRNRVMLLAPQQIESAASYKETADSEERAEKWRNEGRQEAATASARALLPTESADISAENAEEFISYAQALQKSLFAQDGGLEGILQEPPGLVLLDLIAMIDRRCAEPQGHSARVARYALRLGQELATLYEEQRAVRPLLPRITAADLADLAFGALVHDIGKVILPDAVLRKEETLTEEEWRQIRRHPLVGADLISAGPLLARALPVVRSHHERWDGTGYPQGLIGEAIPLVARLFMVCDTLDVLMSDRPYRARMDYAGAREEIACGAGTHFDPDVVAAFLRIPESEWQRLYDSVPATQMLRSPLSHAA